MVLPLALLLRTVPGQRPRQRRGHSSKVGCPFYVAFTALHDNPFRYQCSGIHSEHTCERDPSTWDRFPHYRLPQDPQLRSDAVLFMDKGLRSGQAATVLNAKYGSHIRPKDIHRIVQTDKEKTRFFRDAGVATSETQRLIDEIERNGDQYRVKYKEGTQIVEYLLYWDPTDVQLARQFCQVRHN